MKTGIIKFKLSNEGSKSEKMTPFIKEKDGSVTEIYKNGDNPFDNESLKNYEGMEVKITGKENEFGIFCVDSVEPLDVHSESEQ